MPREIVYSPVSESFRRKMMPRPLPTGERFCMNLSILEKYPISGEVKSLLNRVRELKNRFSSVVVKRTATDVFGRVLPDHVAVFVGDLLPQETK